MSKIGVYLPAHFILKNSSVPRTEIQHANDFWQANEGLNKVLHGSQAKDIHHKIQELFVFIKHRIFKSTCIVSCLISLPCSGQTVEK